VQNTDTSGAMTVEVDGKTITVDSFATERILVTV
jgi:hypothetical protein